MKLTKIESYEIQAFAFRVMTGYMAPGKDVSPLACEAPYEERCAAWDEWRNKHAHCILAMLHGFEALIDRDDEPTGALLDRLDAAERECERLRDDAERYRWLRGDSCPNHSSRWTQWEVRCWKAPYWTGDLRRADLDDAIDAAIDAARERA